VTPPAAPPPTAEPPPPTAEPPPPATAPAVAVNAPREGHALLRCTVTPQGKFSDCRVLKETPPGLGFGAASLRMSKLLTVTPPLRDGLPVAGVMTFPMTWRLPPTPASAPKAADGTPP
jgi:TonB family protein